MNKAEIKDYISGRFDESEQAQLLNILEGAEDIGPVKDEVQTLLNIILDEYSEDLTKLIHTIDSISGLGIVEKGEIT